MQHRAGSTYGKTDEVHPVPWTGTLSVNTIGVKCFETETLSAGFSWTPREQKRCGTSEIASTLPAQSTPANSTLLDWCKKPGGQPPQSWWDDKDDPFAPITD